MVTGIGVDIEKVKRFEKLTMKDDQKFLELIFTKKELDYCLKKEMPGQHLAGKYAGKEAIIKALNSIGIIVPVYTKMEILNDKKGIPRAKLYKDIIIEIKVSIAHNDDYAIA